MNVASALQTLYLVFYLQTLLGDDFSLLWQLCFEDDEDVDELAPPSKIQRVVLSRWWSVGHAAAQVIGQYAEWKSSRAS